MTKKIIKNNNLYHAVFKTLSLMVCWVVLVGVLNNMLGRELASYPKIINIAGKQRMLSQKAAYIAVSKLNKEKLVNEFNGVKQELISNHYFLTQHLNTNELIALYSEQKIGNKLNAYLKLLENYNPYLHGVDQNSSAKYIELKEIYAQSQSLLKLLDHAVSTFEEASKYSANSIIIYRVVFALMSIALMALLYYFILAKALRTNTKDVLSKDKTILRFKKLFDYSHEGLVILDKNWNIQHTNQAAEQILLGSKTKHTIDNFWQSTLNEDLKLDIIAKIRTSGKWEGQLSSPIQENNVFYLSIFEIKGEQTKADFYGATVRDITELMQKESDLHNLALFDGLTGLANRPNVIEKLRLACEQAREEQFAILFLDLDGFKQINDGYGHEVGDRLLVEVACRLKQLVKQSDIVARLGGDEFVIMAKNIKDKNCLISMSQRILKAFESPLSCADYKLKTSLSIGISFYPDDAENPIDLLKKADLAMYSSKQKGKNQFYFFNSAMELYLQERFSFEEDLKFGLQNNEFYQVFQPIVEADSQMVIGCEVLLRWNSARRSMVSPASFIPMCESLNLMPMIDEFVFSQSLKILKILPEHLYYAINLPATHLYNTIMLEDFVKQLSAIENKKRVIFEITETSLIKDITRSIKIIKLIRESGFTVAVDDFGTGYTSLQNLKMLDFDIIKIDRTFIKDLTVDNRSKSIVKAVTNLAHDMDMKVVAEGVEDKETQEYLQGISCDCIQGFYHSKPLSFSEFKDFVENRNQSI